jgi:hypothetical protein
MKDWSPTINRRFWLIAPKTCLTEFQANRTKSLGIIYWTWQWIVKDFSSLSWSSNVDQNCTICWATISCTMNSMKKSWTLRDRKLSMTSGMRVKIKLMMTLQSEVWEKLLKIWSWWHHHQNWCLTFATLIQWWTQTTSAHHKNADKWEMKWWNISWLSINRHTWIWSVPWFLTFFLKKTTCIKKAWNSS